MNRIIFSTQHVPANTYANQPVQFSDPRLYRENYETIQTPQPSFVRRYTYGRWGTSLAGQNLQAGQQCESIVADGDFAWLVAPNAGGGLRVLKVDLATQQVVWSVVADANYSPTSSYNREQLSLTPAGLDIYKADATTLKMRVANDGVVARAFSQFGETTESHVTANPYFTSPPYQPPATGTLRYVARNNQPRYNRGNAFIQQQVARKWYTSGTPIPNSRSRSIVKVGTMNASGAPAALSTVWDDELIRDAPASEPNTSGFCAEQHVATYDGQVYWIAGWSPDIWAGHALFGAPAWIVNGQQVRWKFKCHTPWETVEFASSTPSHGGPNYTTMNVFAFAHEVYPDGLVMLYPTGPTAWRLGYIDPGRSWTLDVPIVSVTSPEATYQPPIERNPNSDETALWLNIAAGADLHAIFPSIFPAGSSRAVKTGVRLHKNGLSAEWHSQIEFRPDGPPIAGRLYHRDELMKRGDCISAGPPGQYPL